MEGDIRSKNKINGKDADEVTKIRIQKIIEVIEENAEVEYDELENKFVIRYDDKQLEEIISGIYRILEE